MPRAIVTAELAETLRSIRLQNKIQAKKLADHINKSPAYISKLESGGIQTIDTQELYSILQFILGENNSSELANKIYKSLKIKYSAKEIEEQLWFTNYDTVECLLPIPESLINEMNSRIASLNISRQYLNSRINANEALPKEEIENSSIPFNQWYHQDRIGGNAQCIKIHLSEEKMNAILDYKCDVAPYIFVFSILFYILKIEKYGDTISLTDEQNSELMNQTTEILNSHKFLSIAQKNALIAQREPHEEIKNLLSSFDNDNIEILNEIISGFRIATDYNIKSTNEKLKAFSDNMKWDLGFMLRLISLNYSSLENISVSNKKNLLSEIDELIKKYVNLPKVQNQIEEY